MTQMQDGLQLYFPFHEVTEGRVTDLSGNGHHGKLVGSPQLISDPFLGAVLYLDGRRDQAITIASDQGLQVEGDMTLAMWLRPAELGSEATPFHKANGGEGALVLRADGTLVYQYGTAGEDAEPRQEVGSGQSLEADAWSHVAVVRHLDGGTVTWYVDGVQTHQVAAEFERAEAGGSPITLGQGPGGPFTGSIAHLRLYGRALTAYEILLDRDADQTVVAAFRESHPIAFTLADEDEHPALSIVDASATHTYHLEVLNTSRRNVHFRNLADTETSSEGVTESSAFFELAFRPGILLESSLDALTVVEGGWSIGYGLRPDGTVALLFRSMGDVTLQPGGALRLTLQNLGIAPNGGSRGTRVVFRYHHLRVGDGQPMSGQRLQHLSVINERGRKHLPLHIGFSGSSGVLNDGATTNQLTLRITNTLTLDPAYPERSTLRFNSSGHAAPSKLILSFETQGEEESHPRALATHQQALGFAVSTASRKNIPPEGAQGESPEWVLPLDRTELAAGDFIDITVDQIKTALPTGPATLYIHCKNLPDYRDETLQATVHKSPLIFRDLRLGIGVTHPETQLHVRGSEDPTLRIQSDGTDEVSGRLSLRQSNNTGADLYYDGRNANDGVAVELFSSDRSRGTPLFISNQSGKVGHIGIGLTQPETLLHVKGSKNPTLRIQSDGTDEVSGRLSLRQSNNTGADLYYDGRSKTEGLTVELFAGKNPHGTPLFISNKAGSVGHIGLGNRAPSSLLELGSFASYSDNYITVNNAGGWKHRSGLKLRVYQDKFGFTIENDDRKPSIGLNILRHDGSTAGTSALFIRRDNGNVGVGTTQPSSKLEVAGTVEATSLKLGNTSIDEDDLKFLKRLASGQQFALYNTRHREYLYAASDGFNYDHDRRRVFTWRKDNQRVSQGYWKLHF